MRVPIFVARGNVGCSGVDRRYHCGLLLNAVRTACARIARSHIGATSSAASSSHTAIVVTHQARASAINASVVFGRRSGGRSHVHLRDATNDRFHTRIPMTTINPCEIGKRAERTVPTPCAL